MDITQEVIDNLNNLIINKHIGNITSLGLGFIPKRDCSLNILPILIHAFENKEIFNEKQLNNLINIYKYITNGNR